MLEFRKWALPAAALAVVALCGQPARPAQKDTKKERGREKLIAQEGAIEIVLMRHKAVRDDLKLTDQQAAKVREFASKQWKRAQEVGGLPTDKQASTWKEMARQDEQFLRDTLSADQRMRLEQIGIQVAGLLWVTRPDVARKLNLTDEQKKKAREVRRTAHKEMQEAVYGGSDEGREARIRAQVKANRKRLMDLLTEEQRATWKRLAGPPFKGDLSKD
jgi:hypothetical protein